MDSYNDYKSFLFPILKEVYRILKNTGQIFVHLDWHEVHYVKVWLDEIFSRENFRNEIIWHSEIGRSVENVWARKHTTILWYTKSNNYTFNKINIPNITRKAQKEGYPNSKLETDVWTYNLSTTDGERVGYPNQKPLEILNRIIKVHSNEGDLILDCFGGSGTTAHSCLLNNRKCITCDTNPQSIDVMEKRLGIKMSKVV